MGNPPMQTDTFRALRVTETEPGIFSRSITRRNLNDLPTGDLLISVQYAALNYKDALSATGHRGVTKNYPHTPGIDGAGTIVTSTDPRFSPGDKVLVTSYDLGMNTDGAFAQYIRVPASWAIPLPDGLSLQESMIIGTAGLTAAIGLHKMEKMGQTPDL
ncbi:MAG: oxidoreductase, partial [Cyclobacteriaceae bacterium]|nr:oxidoreductase [Cyclobacteriaceae bacterium]